MSGYGHWEGMDELRAAMRKIADGGLSGEAGHIVEGSTNAAVTAIKAGYSSHRRSGNLNDGVSSTLSSDRNGAAGIVRSSSPHAWIFENGTQARHSALGANRGSMPPGHVFVPAVVKERKRMYIDLKALVERAGFEVSDE